jgi:hypothetical protein
MALTETESTWSSRRDETLADTTGKNRTIHAHEGLYPE